MDIIELRKLARKMKKKPTQWERAFMDKLKQWGIHFQSQFVIAPYIPDIYLPQYRVIVEIDGAHHYSKRSKLKDKKRTDYLVSKGFQVVRIPNFLVKDYTKEDLLYAINATIPQPTTIDKSYFQNYLATLSY